MTIEIFIAIILVCFSIYILYKNIKTKASGKCDCGSCTSHCKNYKK